MCLAAAADTKTFQAFIALVRQYSWIDAKRMELANWRGYQYRVNMCYGIFGS